MNSTQHPPLSCQQYPAAALKGPLSRIQPPKFYFPWKRNGLFSGLHVCVGTSATDLPSPLQRHTNHTRRDNTPARIRHQDVDSSKPIHIPGIGQPESSQKLDALYLCHRKAKYSYRCHTGDNLSAQDSLSFLAASYQVVEKNKAILIPCASANGSKKRSVGSRPSAISEKPDTGESRRSTGTLLWPSQFTTWSGCEIWG